MEQQDQNNQRSHQSNGKKATPQIAGLKSMLSDAEKALTLLESPEYVRIDEQYKRWLDEYEAVLHDPNVDDYERTIACHVVDKLTKKLNIKKLFESKRGFAETELRKINDKARPLKKKITDTFIFTR